MATAPPKIRVTNKLDINKFIRKLANQESVNKAVQKAVFEKATENYKVSYEKAYKSLVRQILRHLQNGFPGAPAGGSISIAVENPFTGGFQSFSTKWAAFHPDYANEKRRAFHGASRGFSTPKSKSRARTSDDTSLKFWVFRRNLANAAMSAEELNESLATVELQRNWVKKNGVLVSGRNKATIRYSVGLRFGKFQTPFDDMVRKPFITGLKEKSRVWDDSPGTSAKRGVHVLAYVEAKRPFIVDLSASVGKMVRQRLKMN